MRGQDLLEVLGYIEEDLVADADEAESLSVGTGWKRWTALAACIVLVAVGVAVMRSSLQPDDGLIQPSVNHSTLQTSTSVGTDPSDTPSSAATTTTTDPSRSTTSTTPSTVVGSTTRITTAQTPTSTGTRTTPSVGPTSSVDPTTQPTLGTSPAPTGTTGVVSPPATGPIEDGTPPSVNPSSPPPTIHPEADLLDQILRDYQLVMYRPSAPVFAEDVSVSIDRYIGRYGDVTAVRIRDTEMGRTQEHTLFVAGITVHIPAGWPLWLYRNGEFCTLSQAYEAGWITAADVAAIHEQLTH